MAGDKTNPMIAQRIAEQLVPFVGPASLTDSQLNAIKAHTDLLLKWNAKFNLTSICDPQEIITRHFGESLFAASQLFPSGDSIESVIDVGSGAGFPGLPLKLWSPSLNLTLIESNQRKSTFLREVVRTLHLKSVSVLTERAESISLSVDLVMFRAVERFERILPIASSLVKPLGRIAILVASQQVGLATSALSNVDWKAPIAIPLSKSRTLLVGNRRNSVRPT